MVPMRHPRGFCPPYLIFKNAPASELTLTLAGPHRSVLVMFFFLVLARTFGTRVMLYVMVIWGATDFYTFTANFMGSTLRQDWLVALDWGCARSSANGLA